MYFKTYFAHPQNLNSQCQLRFGGETETQAQRVEAYRTVTQPVPSRKVHLTGFLFTSAAKNSSWNTSH